MNTSFITYATMICLTVLAAAGISHATEKVRVFEMADGNIVTFKMTPEEIAAQEASIRKLKRSQSVARMKPKKDVLVFEMGESGITVSFPSTEKEAAERSENPDWLKLYDALSNQSQSRVESVELPETGFYLFFTVNRGGKEESKYQAYSQKPQ